MSTVTGEAQRSVRAQRPHHDSVPLLAEGDRLTPGYMVVAHLHRGDALDVYEVWSAERECRCVAKVLRPDRLEHPGDRQRVLREGRLLQRLTHPHIVRAYEPH